MIKQFRRRLAQPVLLAGLLALASLASLASLALAAPNAGAQAASDGQPSLDQETNPQRLIQVVAEAQRKGDLDTMQKAAHRLVQQRPYVGAYAYLLAKAYALADKKSEAYNTLLMLHSQGLSFDLSKDPDLENIRNFEVYDYLQSGFTRNAKARGEPLERRELARRGLLADGLAWDPKRKQFLVGSVTEGTVWLIDDSGEATALVTADATNGLLGVFDIAVDPKRRSLWVSSAAVPHYRNIRFQDIGRTSVIEVNLDSGKLRGRYDLPGLDPANKLVNLTVAPDGSVFVANSGPPEVYRIDPADKTMSRIFQAPNFTSLRGLAVSPDGSTLFFSDYELGLFGVDLAAQKAYQVTAAPDVNLGGIDSLSWFEDGLIAVQNGNFPNRVLRIVLDGDRHSVTSTGPLLINHGDFMAPSEGIVVGERFVLLARNTAALYDGRSGKPRPDVALPPQVLISIDTDTQSLPKPDIQSLEL